MKKRVMLVAAVFPPQLGGTSEKMAKRVKYFSRFGWQTAVLAPNIPPDTTLDETLLKEIGDTEVHRTNYLLKSSWPSLRHDKNRQTNFSGSQFEQIFDMGFVPKGYIRWLPYALQKGRQLAKTVDVVLTMNNPVSLHIVGYILHKLTGKPWVAELRDPIVNYAYGKRGPEKLNLWLEKVIVNNADVVIQREDGTPDMVHVRYPNLPRDKFVVIPYAGYDPDDFPEQTAKSVKRAADGPLHIAYTGSFYGDTITPIPFLKALKRFLTTENVPPESIRVTFAGDWDADYDRFIQELGLNEIVTYQGRITRQQCISLWQTSDVLLLLLAKEEDNVLRIPSKFWDYLGAQSPMLSLVAPNGRLANLMREQKLGAVAHPEDVAGIANAIKELYDAHQEQRLTTEPTPEFLSLADRASSQKAVVDVFDKLVGNSPK